MCFQSALAEGEIAFAKENNAIRLLIPETVCLLHGLPKGQKTPFFTERTISVFFSYLVGYCPWDNC